MRKSYNVINTFSASEDDNCVVSNHMLSITGAPVMDVRKVTATWTDTVAEVAGVVTVTATAANSTEYRLLVKQFNHTNKTWYQNVFSYTSDASATATEIANALKTAIDADPALFVSTVGGATLVITADAGYAIVKGVSVGSGTLGVVQTTTGVAPVGTYAMLVANGVDATLLTAGGTYDTITFSDSDALGKASWEHKVYASVGGANFAVFDNRAGEVIDGLAADGTTTNIEHIALGAGH